MLYYNQAVVMLSNATAVARMVALFADLTIAGSMWVRFLSLTGHTHLVACWSKTDRVLFCSCCTGRLLPLHRHLHLQRCADTHALPVQYIHPAHLDPAQALV